MGCKTIWKYSITMADEQIVRMPKDAKVLTVKVQNGEVFLWALVDAFVEQPGSESLYYEPRSVHVRCTDDNCNDVQLGWYVGTVLLRMETLVFHVFVEPSKVKRVMPGPVNCDGSEVKRRK